MGKRIGCVLLLLTVCFCSGCYDRVEVSNELYAIVLGVDECENGLRMTFLLPVYREQHEGAGSVRSYSVEAENIFEGIGKINMELPRKVSLLHLKTVIFSRSLAEHGVREVTDQIRRQIETENAMGILIASPSAEALISFMEEHSTGVLSQEMEQLLFRKRDHLYFPVQTFEEFCRSLESEAEQPYAVYCRSDGKKTGGVFGTAVFCGDQMAGTLNAYETACTMMVRGEFGGGSMTFGSLITEILPRPTVTISVDTEGQKPKILVHLRAEGGAFRREDREQAAAAAQLAGRELKRLLERTLRKTQQMKSDLWGFGNIAEKNFPTIPKWRKYGWAERFSQAEIRVETEFVTVRTGVNKR